MVFRPAPQEWGEGRGAAVRRGETTGDAALWRERPGQGHFPPSSWRRRRRVRLRKRAVFFLSGITGFGHSSAISRQPLQSVVVFLPFSPVKRTQMRIWPSGEPDGHPPTNFPGRLRLRSGSRQLIKTGFLTLFASVFWAF